MMSESERDQLEQRLRACFVEKRAIQARLGELHAGSSVRSLSESVVLLVVVVVSVSA